MSYKWTFANYHSKNTVQQPRQWCQRDGTAPGLMSSIQPNSEGDVA